MSDANKKLLTKKFQELESEIGTNPETRKLDDHVLLVDGFNTFIRSFSVNPSLNEDGEHVGGLVGFLKSIRYTINKFKPTRCIIVFDGKNSSKPRQKIYPQYKSGRKVRSRLNRLVDWSGSPHDEYESMKLQIKRLIEYLECLPLTIVSIDNLEADDIMSYIPNVVLKDSKFTIMSADKDFYQLVDERVKLYSPTKKIVYDRERVKKEFGVYPQNVLTCRVVDGDKSDDIPGVRGIGVKTLIKEFPLLVEDRVFNTKDLLDMAKSRNTRISKMIQDNELIIKRNYLLMQLGDPDIKNQTKLKIGDSVRGMAPKLVKYQLQTLFVKDKLWGQIPNFDNWLTEFNILDHYWKNKK
jgi:5'-3' exonuclease